MTNQVLKAQGASGQEPLKSQNGQLVVASGGGFVPDDMDNSLNRIRTGITTRKSATWNASDNVTQVTVNVRRASAGNDDLVCHVTFNATDDAEADSWLTVADSATAAAKFYIVHVGQPRTFRFTGAVTRADVLRGVGVQNATVMFEAESV